MKRVLLPLLLALGMTSASGEETKSPRAVAEAAAKTIAERYFDAKKGERIASELRAAAAKGEFDALTDVFKLSDALTQRLQSEDRHFRVIWDKRAEPAASATTSDVVPRIDGETGMRYQNFGFRTAQVLQGNVGYIDMTAFADFRSFDEPARKAADAALALVANSEALIIDLRSNGGGSPAMVGYLASAFLKKGAPVFNTFHSRNGPVGDESPEVWYAQPRPEWPLVILTSKRTASAAESFSYTLQNAGRAQVVGERTAGAANPGGMNALIDGFALFVSDGTPINPISKTNWETVGVIPGIEVKADEALLRAHVLALETAAKQAQGPLADLHRWFLDGLKAKAAPQPANAEEFAGVYGGARYLASKGKLLRVKRSGAEVEMVAMGKDLFVDAEDMRIRVRFSRNQSGAVDALTLLALGRPPERINKDS